MFVLLMIFAMLTLLVAVGAEALHKNERIALAMLSVCLIAASIVTWLVGQGRL